MIVSSYGGALMSRDGQDMDGVSIYG